jgi:4-phosphopantoate--beta-alanine ligase
MDEIAADPSHPRYASLLMRHRLEAAAKRGMLADSAMIAHGRGEAFDYLLGERTTPSARLAGAEAMHRLWHAQRPVLSLNGNVAALAADDMLRLASRLGCPVEVNIFYRTPERMNAILSYIEERKEVLGLDVVVLGDAPNAAIPGLKGPRAACHREGILDSDVILVPLEDGDRCKALVAMGKTVIVIDLNPLSRSAQQASITVVDELSRALATMLAWDEGEMPEAYDHQTVLKDAHKAMLDGLSDA